MINLSPSPASFSAVGSSPGPQSLAAAQASARTASLNGTQAGRTLGPPVRRRVGRDRDSRDFGRRGLPVAGPSTATLTDPVSAQPPEPQAAAASQAASLVERDSEDRASVGQGPASPRIRSPSLTRPAAPPSHSESPCDPPGWPPRAGRVALAAAASRSGRQSPLRGLYSDSESSSYSDSSSTTRRPGGPGPAVARLVGGPPTLTSH